MAAGKNGKNNGQFQPGNPHRIKPGEVRNPTGRPKEKPITDALRAAMLEDDGEKLRAIINGVIYGALKGNAKNFEVVRETLEGKLPQPVEHSGHIAVLTADERRAELRRLIAGLTGKSE